MEDLKYFIETTTLLKRLRSDKMFLSMNDKEHVNESSSKIPTAESVVILKFSNDRQIKIWQALGKLHSQLGPRIASMYEGIILALNSNNPEKVSIVSHLARELSAILPNYISELPVKQEKISDSQIKKDLNIILGLLGTNADSDLKIKKIVEELISKIPDQLTQPEILKKVVDSHPLLGSRPSYLNDAFVKQWMLVHNYFQKHAHHDGLKSKNSKPSSDMELNTNWEIFETLIYRVLVPEPFFGAIGELDKLLKIIDPTEQNVDELMRNIVEPQHRRYFFDKCDNPKWLDLLNKKNAFSNPQEPIKKDGYVQFIGWPESQYLVKIASEKSREVYEIIKKLTTENQSVLDDFISAALKSPADIASLYVDIILKNKWLHVQYNLRLPTEIGDLMNKLSVEGEVNQALRLANELFTLTADKAKNEGDPEYRKFFHPDAKSLFSEWEYGEIMKNKTQTLAKLEPVKLFAIYIYKLKDAITFEDDEDESHKRSDYSYIWRPNLSKARLSRDDVKNILLDSVIDLVKQNSDNHEKLKEFTSILKKQENGIFRRIEMFIYNIKPLDFISESENILKEKEIIFSSNLKREYLPLLGATFEKLSKEGQTEILKYINEGPVFTKHEGTTDERIERIRAHWKSSYLVPIKDFLLEEEKVDYKKNIDKYGESVGTFDDDDVITTWSGNQSPISSEELSKLNGKETLNYLADYKTPDDPFAHSSSSGLGMIFAGLVAENPEKYVSVTNLFFEKNIRPIFFYHLINGLKDSLKKHKCFDWQTIIGLCHKVIIENKYESKPANEDEQDWNSVRQTVADFLGNALGGKSCEIPISLKGKVWEILLNLSEDPKPTLEDELRDGEGGLDPMTLAINTTRGEAIGAVINYGLWIARNLTDKTIQIKMPPEVTELLNKHLDINKDSSLAIRSVYGWRLPNLFYLNKPWVEANKNKIFSKDSPNYLLAAWEGYLANGIITELFSILKEKYIEFIPHLGTIEKKGYRAADINQRFPQHIAIIYANEQKYDDFVKEFFRIAPEKSRAEVINFIGRVALRQMENFKHKKETKKRFAQLWNNRISLPQNQIGIEELKEFGWWFKVSPLNKKCTLGRMIKTLQLTGGIIDVPYEIVEELKSCAVEFPIESITILDLISRAKREFQQHLYNKQDYIEVIKLVKSTGNKDAKKIADELINYFGSIGLIEDFRNLL